MRRALLALSLLAVAGCKPTRRYESAVQIIRMEELEKDADGTVIQEDLELEWDSCPGDQFQVVRGGKEFAACMKRYQVGDFVPVLVVHYWDDRGYYRWSIERVGDCARPIEHNTQGSYEKSAECHDVVEHGVTVGFECSREPQAALLRRCPWMARQ